LGFGNKQEKLENKKFASNAYEIKIHIFLIFGKQLAVKNNRKKASISGQNLTGIRCR